MRSLVFAAVLAAPASAKETKTLGEAPASGALLKVKSYCIDLSGTTPEEAADEQQGQESRMGGVKASGLGLGASRGAGAIVSAAVEG